MGKALYEFGLTNNGEISILSMHDHAHQADGNVYFPAEIFKGYGTAKSWFILNAVKQGRHANVVIISHINLLIAGWFIKKINPSAKIILMVHGIEIWGSLNFLQRKMLCYCDKILCVSSHTLNTIASKHALPAEKLTVLNNCLDPFLTNNITPETKAELRQKYGFSEDAIVLLTLTRLSLIDRYKGYSMVINAMVKLVAENKNIYYLLAGSYKKEEKIAIDALIIKNGLSSNVVLAGYLPEEELATHFSMADLYVMPSSKEGFGIVFIEAMLYGLPAIAGNKDGSTDALLQGKLGLLVDPYNVEEIGAAISTIIKNRAAYKPDHALLMEHFGYDAYKRKLEAIITSA